MRTIDFRLLRKPRQALEVGVHLRRLTFEQAAAAHGEEGIADEDDFLRRQIVGDMAGGMGGDFHHRRLDRTQLDDIRSEEHTSELQSLLRISYAVFCLKKKTKQ